MTKVYVVKKGANLSRCKKVNGILTSNNIINSKNFVLDTNNLVDVDYDDHINCSFYEFNNKEFGNFMVLKSSVKKIKFTLNRHNIEHKRFLEKAYKQGKDKGLSNEVLTEYTKLTAQKLNNERAI